MSHLASRPEYTSTISDMSEATQVPAPYLRKVLNRLRDAEIIGTQRGTGGGIYLKADPEELTILKVLTAVDPIKRIERCPLGLPEHFKLCPLHSEINEAILQVESVLNSKTLADLLAMKRSGTAYCDFPVEKKKNLYQL
jgi:Rrf2 family protein